jgi:cytochrome c-type biogenesis protein
LLSVFLFISTATKTTYFFIFKTPLQQVNLIFLNYSYFIPRMVLIMYQVLSDISRLLSEPFYSMIYDSNQIPLIAAFVLGLIGALAPCQLTGNISAITFYGNRSLQTNKQWIEVIFFIFGKLFVFSILGLFVWIIGQEFQQSITSFFSWFRKFIGPFILFLGLFLFGWIRLSWINKISAYFPQYTKKGKLGSFFMGVTFSIAFCPTMFMLFFVTLMPLVLQSSYGMILPAVFGIGTSVPLIVLLLIIWFLGIDGSLLKKSRKFGTTVQKFAGVILIIIGLFDTITYWG